MTTNGAIFNVQEPTGAEASAFQTTAATAQAEAPNSSEARKVERTADVAQDAAADAAHLAQAKGSALTGETSTTEQLSNVKNAAVSEGQHDVEAAKSTGAGLVQQVRQAADNVLGAAQTYLGQAGNDTDKGPANSTADTLHNAANKVAATTAAALGTAREYVAAGSQAAANKAAGHEDATVYDAAGGVKQSAGAALGTAAGYAQAAANSDAAKSAGATASSAASSAYNTASTGASSALGSAKTAALGSTEKPVTETSATPQTESATVVPVGVAPPINNPAPIGATTEGTKPPPVF